jgi:hypothetical protein
MAELFAGVTSDVLGQPIVQSFAVTLLMNKEFSKESGLMLKAVAGQHLTQSP